LRATSLSVVVFSLSLWGQFEQCGKGTATNMQHLGFLIGHVQIDLRKHPVEPPTNLRAILTIRQGESF
jgi:hypothetical protein